MELEPDGIKLSFQINILYLVCLILKILKRVEMVLGELFFHWLQ